MRRALVAVALLSVATAAVAGAVASGGAQGANTITVVVKPTDYRSVRFVDLAPKSTTGNPDHISPGDVILQTVTVRNQAGRRIGTRYDELTFVTPSANARSIDLVRSVYVFGDGRVFTQGLHGPTLNGADAVTGGTGAYAGARGTLADVSAKNSKSTTLAIRLLP